MSWLYSSKSGYCFSITIRGHAGVDGGTWGYAGVRGGCEGNGRWARCLRWSEMCAGMMEELNRTSVSIKRLSELFGIFII